VLKGYPHTVLQEQHRMRPEISELVRLLTYPELRDAPKTQGRPRILGVPKDIIFIDHEEPEEEDDKLHERRDVSGKASKQNK